ncbi:MAG: hypothetical protein JWP01_1490 [Myxococcales bacterium]|nr:hypothetical protein [Myxococcales bacterium]
MFSTAGTIVAFTAWMMARTRRFRRRINRQRLWRLSQLPEGTYGRIVGRAHPIGEPLISPMTGRRCVYYEVVVEGKGLQPKPAKMTIVAHEVKAMPFLLVDGTGRAVIDPAGADLLVDFDARSGFGSAGQIVTPAHQELFARHGRTVLGGMYGTDLRYRESVIEIEDMITVLGVGTREPDPEATGHGSRSRFRFTHTAKRPLMITDDWSASEKPYNP